MTAGAERARSAVERQVLGFAAVHRAFLAAQVAIMLDEFDEGSAGRLLAALEAAGLVDHHRRAPNAPAAFRITAAGLRLIESDLPPPEVSEHLPHELGVVWVWLAARLGRLGEISRQLTEREMRAADTPRRSEPPPPGSKDAPYGLALRGATDGQRPRLYYPDLILVAAGGRIPVHLLLSPPSSTALDALLVAYAADARVTRVLFALTQPTSAGQVMVAAAKRDLLGLVEVYPMSLAADLASAAGR